MLYVKVGEYKYMADNKASSLKQTRARKKVSALDTIAKKILGTVDSSVAEREYLTRQDERIQRILADEINFSRGISGGVIVDFVSTMASQNSKAKDGNELDATSLFTKDVGDIYGYFQDMYKNHYLEISDLKFITKFIPGIGEAVKTTLDSIVSADDVTSSITRNLVLGSNLTKNEQAQVLAEIKRIEKDEKLLKKLKNIVYNKTLVTGTHYVYHIPYAELFQEYDRMVKEGKINTETISNKVQITNNRMRVNNTNDFNLNSSANEGYFGIVDVADESFISESIDGMKYLDINEKKAVRNIFANGVPFRVTVNNSPYIGEAIESVTDYQQLGDRRISPYYSAYYGGVAEVSSVDTEGSLDQSGKHVRGSKFNLSGTYLKYIDAKHIIPIRVYNTVVGYYYIHNQSSAKKAQKASNLNGHRDTNFLSTGQSIFSSTNLSEKKKDQVMNDIVDSIAEGIMTSFSVRFVSKYAEHKKLIADCIIANGLINNDYSIQFIPKEYITAFTINENEDGNGESMLMNSLFPAKMLLSLVITKLLNYMNNSGQKTISYVGKGPIDVGSSNHIQRVLRMMQDGKITFNDMLSTNLVFSKISRNNNIQLPRSKDGTKLIEFELQEGQNIEMRPDMEDWLEKLAIMGTGVPSAIMEFVDAVDYSKSLTTANIKHASRVASYQSDLEESTTELYKALIAGSTLSDDLKTKAINSFEFKLARPRVLANANVAEFIDTLERSAETMANIVMAVDEGSATANPDNGKIKAKFKKNYIIRNAPFLDMESIENDYKRAVLDVQSEKDLDSKNENGEGIDAPMGGNDSDEGNPPEGFF